MSADYDAIVIGGGHNGLVAAAWLAKAGCKVLLLEKRPTLGGAASTEELFPGYHFNTGAPDAGLLSTRAISTLALEKQGLQFIDNEVAAFAPQPDGRALTLWRDTGRTIQEIAQISKPDAIKFPNYQHQTGQFAGIMAEIAQRQPPALKDNSADLMLTWANLALKVRGLGKRDMMEFLRVLPMSAYQYLSEHFEGDALKGLLASVSVTGLMLGPHASGTAFMLLYQQLGGLNGGYRSSRIVRGGVGKVSEALFGAVKSYGSEIRTSVTVSKIIAERNRVLGVELEGGETIKSNVVLSSADPRTTFFDLLGAPNLGPRVMRRLRSLKLRGSTASIHLALSGRPDFPAAQGETNRLTGAIVVCPGLDYAERAYDDAKYGRISSRPILEAYIPSLLDDSMAPRGQHAISVVLRYAPYQLRDSEWNKERETLGDLAVETLSQYSPNLKLLTLNRKVITPLDYESDYGLAEGSIMHGQMGLDQLLLMRPVPGFVGYRSPVAGLYLCGAGAHPGGGVTGMPGLNAARQVIKEIR